MVISNEQVSLIEAQIKANPLPGYQYLQMLSGSFNGVPSYYINFKQFLIPFGLNKITGSEIVIINDTNQLLILENNALEGSLTAFDCALSFKSRHSDSLTIDEFKSIMNKATLNKDYTINDRNGRIMVHVDKNINSVIWGINQLLALRNVAFSTLFK